MKNINILIVCNAGLSTSLLIEKVEKAGAVQSIEVIAEAQPVDDVKSHVADRDVILLGPQVRYKQKQINTLVEGKIPVSVIDMSAYGTMDGEKILNQAISLIEQ